jgi:Phosphotransferase enzyme family
MHGLHNGEGRECSGDNRLVKLWSGSSVVNIPPRVATLVLVDAQGRPLGALPPFEAETPWWMDIGPVVRATRATHGLRVTVLRLLDAQLPAAHGGAVTYLAQLEGDAGGTPLQPWAGSLPDHPLRHPYARVNGPHADLAWAEAMLRSAGGAVTGEPEQIRTWNLSSLWRLHSTAGPVWLKVVPPFFAHEGALIDALRSEAVPRLLGRDGRRLLMAQTAGEDLYGATLAERRAMIDLLVALQRRWCERADELLALRLPDWRAPALCAAITALLQRRADAVLPADRALLDAFVESLPARCAAIAACGLPEGLVHGDFHGGNWRGGNGHALTLLDWGDSGVGHPLLDMPAFLGRSPSEQAEPLRTHWCAVWQRAFPGCDPARASTLLAPIAAARQALIYQRFLDHIEPAEHPYHRADVPDWLHATADLLRADAD